jgi:hypothetical protein
LECAGPDRFGDPLFAVGKDIGVFGKETNSSRKETRLYGKQSEKLANKYVKCIICITIDSTVSTVLLYGIDFDLKRPFWKIFKRGEL